MELGLSLGKLQEEEVRARGLSFSMNLGMMMNDNNEENKDDESDGSGRGVVSQDQDQNPLQLSLLLVPLHSHSHNGSWDHGGGSALQDVNPVRAAARKKLRLSKQQWAILEERFKQHKTVDPKQKAALAKHLNLSPRQVEVWFQNRRARTKLKLTQVNCDYLNNCCQALTRENTRLRHQLQQFRAALKPPSSSSSSSSSSMKPPSLFYTTAHAQFQSKT